MCLCVYIYIYIYVDIHISGPTSCACTHPVVNTPSFFQVFFQGASVKQVDVPTLTGAFGILPAHVPTLQVLRPGVVTVFSDDGSAAKYFGELLVFLGSFSTYVGSAVRPLLVTASCMPVWEQTSLKHWKGLDVFVHIIIVYWVCLWSTPVVILLMLLCIFVLCITIIWSYWMYVICRPSSRGQWSKEEEDCELHSSKEMYISLFFSI